MTTIKHLFFAFLLSYQGVLAQSFLQDNTKIYAMPLLNQTPKGDVLLSWTEKDTDGKTAFCMALSKDKGHTFSEKKIIATGYGIGNSRLMRARVLSKKDGSLVAVFMNNPNAGPGRGGRGGQVAYCVSKDSGTTWTLPQPVDTDPTPNLMRGFFDATVLANDEVAVAYLKDVKGSTKHEERDLRIAITKNGVFEAEKLIDAVVCDCCNIS
ncbi:MAG: glycoside hydrolase [Spirosomaceae bacterium]|nr:glycoside hydrolase [Spirosomataceae bacterium]